MPSRSATDKPHTSKLATQSNGDSIPHHSTITYEPQHDKSVHGESVALLLESVTLASMGAHGTALASSSTLLQQSRVLQNLIGESEVHLVRHCCAVSNGRRLSTPVHAKLRAARSVRVATVTLELLAS